MSHGTYSDTAADADAVIRVFFDPEANQITAQQIESNKFLQDVVQRLRDGRPTVLPFRPLDRNEVQWFAVALTELEFRELREGIKAFVGSTWAGNISIRVELSGSSPIRDALRAYSNGRIFRLTGDKNGIGRSLKRMFRAWDARPGRVLGRARTPGLIRRDFEVALQAGDNQAAMEALAELRRGGLVDRRNGLFLDVQRLDALGGWNKILELPDLADLVKGRRPAAVTDALLRAAYHVHLAQFDTKDDADGALGAYCSNVAPQFASVLDGIPLLRSTGARIVAAAAAADRQDANTLSEIRGELASAGIEKSIVDTWLEAITPTEETGEPLEDPLAEAERIGRLDKDEGFKVAYEAQGVDSVAQAALLLSFANDVRKMDFIRDALGVVDGMDVVVREQLEGYAWVERVLADLRGEVIHASLGVALPDSWLAWLVRLCTDLEWEREEALHVARMGSHEWTLSDLIANRPPSRVAEDILSIPSKRADILIEVLPLLLSTLQSDQNYPDSTLSPVYYAVLEHLLYESNPTLIDIRVYVDLLPAVLNGRLEPAQYKDAIDGLINALNASQAAPPPQTIIDALDAVLTASCPDTEARMRLFAFAADLEGRHSHRWDITERNLRRSLGEEIGFEESYAAEEEAASEKEHYEDSFKALTNRTVAIYTLIESAGTRAASIIRDTVPGTQVETSAAFVGDERLAAMARNADVFVMVTRSAKHAATDFIQSHRGNKPILRPKGKGVGSIMKCLWDYALL